MLPGESLRKCNESPVKALLTVFTLLAMPAHAEEVRLICTGTVEVPKQVPAGKSENPYTGMQEQDYTTTFRTEKLIREIRFDEDAGEFWYKGASGFEDKKAAAGWVPAEKVKFFEDRIEAKFKIDGARRTLLDLGTLGTSRLFAKDPVGRLDRMSGVWEISGAQLQCRKIEAKDRLF